MTWLTEHATSENHFSITFVVLLKYEFVLNIYTCTYTETLLFNQYSKKGGFFIQTNERFIENIWEQQLANKCFIERQTTFGKCVQNKIDLIFFTFFNISSFLYNQHNMKCPIYILQVDSCWAKQTSRLFWE